METAEAIVRRAIFCEGVVQGVGFRPFVYRLAAELELSGWVSNSGRGVEIEAEGTPWRLDEFLRRIREDYPAGAALRRVEVRAQAPRNERGFAIVQSSAGVDPRPALPVDLAMCAACLADIRNPHSQRYRYPFTTCSSCGPRHSLVVGLPYDRARTTMCRFTMCPDCAREYHDERDRRFHAETIACPACGPKLSLIGAAGRALAREDAALRLAAQMVCDGQIVALKGIGGFQLIVDALDPAAVARLRQRKHRPDKPLAVMFSSVEAMRAHCALSNEDMRALVSAAAPIVLLRKSDREIGPRIAEGVAPRNPMLGAMLPYTPLHALLLEAVRRPVVCTSGNLSEEPICTDTAEALTRLGNVADAFLTHNRPVARPLDDSVVRVGARSARTIRRARGYTPVTIDIGVGPAVLALGGHVKNTIALALDREAILSQHIGDLDSAAARNSFQRAIDDLTSFFRCKPELLACDLHPDYASTIAAERLTERLGTPLIRVQHHHAHVAACIAEHRLEGPVLGFAWDGTGYGTDGTVWGGEALVVRSGAFERVATLRQFALPGGERAIREPRRQALALLRAAGIAPHRYLGHLFAGAEMDRVAGMVDSRINAPLTSSIGRLFDAVAALCGFGGIASFDGQAAMELEHALDSDAEQCGEYSIGLVGEGPIVGDWTPMIDALLEDLRQDVPIARIAARFHNSLAAFAVNVAKRVQIERVVLGGGCFQNEYLLSRTAARLEGAGLEVHFPRNVPPNDGGIALGQAFIARQMAREAGHVPGNPR
ncbi:MAG TPA: carbamoyltransferase HypF [Candidatus Binataceae bacterium]|nr:carbamoyltransferase HypF [Candidatus Binataceae bacterium]